MSQQNIPVPADFPINWENQEDSQLFWSLNKTMYPDPMPPLGFDLIVKFIHGHGINAALNEYQVPIHLRSARFNGYVYDTVVPNPHFRPHSSEEGGMRLQQAVRDLPEQWETTWLPEMREHLAYWERYDLKKATLPDLLTHLDESIDRIRRMWAIHFLVNLPVVVALSQFEDMCGELFQDNAQVLPYQLLAGTEPFTIRANREFWQICHLALSEPAVHEILLQTPEAEVMAALEASAAGQPFLEAFENYLGRYGKQGKANDYINYPSWHEDPTQVIATLKNCLIQPDKDVIAELQRVHTQREEAVTMARSHLSIYPRPVTEQFEFLLKVARTAQFILEEHTYWIELPVTYHARQISLALGQRFRAADAITDADDVFYLTYKELKMAAATSPLASQHELVRQRRPELTQFAKIAPPATLGPVPTETPPPHPVLYAVQKVNLAPPKNDAEPDGFSGYPGSPGIVKGRVRILHTPEDAHKLLSGDILVTLTTSVSWTPLFTIIGGVVTDHGGILCHSAVVAREMGIPAVVGTGQATNLLRDGQMIEVNGNTGAVRYLGDR